MAGTVWKECNEKTNAGYVDIWLQVWMITLGLDTMRQLAPETQIFGWSGWIRSSSSCWEESPGSRFWNNGVAGGRRGCKNDRFGRADGHRAGLKCWGFHSGRQWWPEKLDDIVGYHSGCWIADV